MPKLAEGPPVFVRFTEPLPSPGFMRTAIARPGVARPNASNWCKEQSVQEDPAADVLGDPVRGHLGREEDLLGCEPGAERSLHFPVAGGVHVEPEGSEHGEDPRLGFAFIA